MHSGFATKLGGYFPTWRLRYFEVFADIITYAVAAGKPPRGRILTSDIKEVRVARTGETARPNCFLIFTPQRVYQVEAASQDDAGVWVSAIQAAVPRLMETQERRRLASQALHGQARASIDCVGSAAMTAAAAGAVAGAAGGAAAAGAATSPPSALARASTSSSAARNSTTSSTATQQQQRRRGGSVTMGMRVQPMWSQVGARRGRGVASVGERSLRVFVSATVPDFQRERELLLVRVAAELRAFADVHNVKVTLVDLNWG